MDGFRLGAELVEGCTDVDGMALGLWIGFIVRGEIVGGSDVSGRGIEEMLGAVVFPDFDHPGVSGIVPDLDIFPALAMAATELSIVEGRSVGGFVFTSAGIMDSTFSDLLRFVGFPVGIIAAVTAIGSTMVGSSSFGSFGAFASISLDGSSTFSSFPFFLVLMRLVY